MFLFWQKRFRVHKFWRCGSATIKERLHSKNHRKSAIFHTGWMPHVIRDNANKKNVFIFKSVRRCVLTSSECVLNAISKYDQDSDGLASPHARNGENKKDEIMQRKNLTVACANHSQSIYSIVVISAIRNQRNILLKLFDK